MVTKVTGMMSTGTKGGDIPSASTLVIDTDGDYFDITGTTGITAMTVDAGRRFTLQFDGAVTLTHGSSLYLPGATNFTTEANDCLSFIATAANTVRCTGYALKDGGSPVVAAGGKVLQVVSVTNNTYTSTTSTSWVTTNLTASITPAATSSKIFIIANLTLYFSATGDTPGMTIFRGTVSDTNVADASHGFAYHDIASGIGSGTRTGSLGLNYLDSPSTSSAQVYTIGMRSNGGGTIIKGSNGEHATMTLMEIGA